MGEKVSWFRSRIQPPLKEALLQKVVSPPGLPQCPLKPESGSHELNGPALGTSDFLAGSPFGDRRQTWAAIEDHQPAAIKAQPGQVGIQLFQALGQGIRLVGTPDFEFQAQGQFPVADFALTVAR